MNIKFENADSVRNHNEIGSLTAGKVYELKQTQILNDDGTTTDSGRFVITDDEYNVLQITNLDSCEWIGGAKWVEVE